MYRTTTPSSVLLDDSGPRPLPSYLRQPLPPPPEDKILPCVPDVSLILGRSFNPISKIPVSSPPAASATGTSSSTTTLTNPKPIPNPVTIKQPFSTIPSSISDSLLAELIAMMKTQKVKIDRMENQLQTLITHTLQVSNCSKARVEIGVQTEDIFVPNETHHPNKNKKRPRDTVPCRDRHDIQSVPCQNNQDRDTDVSPNHTSDLSKILKNLQIPLSAEQSIYSVHNSSPKVDLPEFTDHPNLPMNKSETESSPGIGPSVSEYGSTDDDDEPEIQPTVTYYRNVLGNVNRLLENHSTSPPPHSQRHPKPRSRLATTAVANGNGPTTAAGTAKDRANNNLMIQQNVYNSIFIPNQNGGGTGGSQLDSSPNPMPRPRILNGQSPQAVQWTQPNNNSDTTMYGLSSANLSFATRDYLERHGLYGQGGNGQPQNSHGLYAGAGNGQQGQGRLSHPHRNLDSPAWPTQPKF